MSSVPCHDLITPWFRYQSLPHLISKGIMGLIKIVHSSMDLHGFLRTSGDFPSDQVIFQNIWLLSNSELTRIPQEVGKNSIS